MTYNSRVRRAFVAPSAMLAAAGALLCAGVLVAPASAGNPANFGINGGQNVFNAPSIGYPPPGEIYAPFTDCPLNRPDMQTPAESAGGTQVGCAASIAEVKMVRSRIIEIDGTLNQTQTEKPDVKIEIPLRIAGDGCDVMKSTDLIAHISRNSAFQKLRA